MLRTLLSPSNDLDTGKEGKVYEPVLLGGLSVAGYLLFYSLNIFLARNLTREEFNDYNVGVSTLLLLAALAPLGLEKLALKVVPVHLDRREWGLLRGYLRFTLLTTLIVSVLLSLTVDSLLEAVLLMQDLGSHLAIPLIVGGLPLLAVFSVLLEVATASGTPVLAAALYRVALPALMLAFNLAFWRWQGGTTAPMAGWSFLTAWLGVTCVMGWVLLRRVPPQVGETPSSYRSRAWLTESAPLLAHGVLLTAIAQSGVIVLELSEGFHADASVFAIAMQTGAFIVLFSTSTNRFYLPRVSLLLRYKDREGLTRLANRRLLLVGIISAVFVALVVAFGKLVLRAHGEGFEDGYLATCVIAVGAAVSTTFSLSPFGLQFSGLQGYVLRWITLAAVVSIVGCIVMANRYGALGAAVAYAVPLIALHAGLAWKARALLARDNEPQR